MDIKEAGMKIRGYAQRSSTWESQLRDFRDSEEVRNFFIYFGKYNGERLKWFPVTRLLETGAENPREHFYYIEICLQSTFIHGPYDDEKPESVNVNWQSSYMRRWLNNDFYNTAFTDAERKRILSRKVSTPPNTNPCSLTEEENCAGPGCIDVDDYIYLLPIKHVNQAYLRYCYPLGEYNGKKWWLRDNGEDGRHVAVVWGSKLINEGWPPHFRAYVRPSMLIKIYDNEVVR